MVMEPTSEYLRTQVETASPGQLIVLLYDGAIRFLHKALDGFGKTNISERMQTINSNILRAQDIIAELTACLDMEAGGEIATNLFRLYEYMHQILIRANVKKDPKPIHEVIDLMEGLKEAWEEVAIQERRAPSPMAGLRVAV